MHTLSKAVPDHGEWKDARFWLAAIADTSDDAIVGKDLDGVITSWNKAAETMFGYSAQEIIGQPITRIIPFDRLDEEETMLSRVRRNEKIIHLETKRQRKDGRIVPVSLTVSPIRDDSGRIIGISKTARDLTEIQRVHRDLERREALLRSILDCMPDASLVIDRQGLVLSFSLSAQKTFGYMSAEIMGQDVGQLLPATSWNRHNSTLAGYAATGDHPITGVGRRRDGSTFPMKLTIGELDLPHMRLFAAFVHDMTEQVERERGLRGANADLEHVARDLVTARDLADRSDRAKSRLVASMLRDLRGPMNSMLENANQLCMAGELNAAQRRCVAAMRGSGERMLQTLDTAFDPAEIGFTAEPVEVPSEAVDVLAIARACLDRIQPAARTKNLALRIIHPPNLGARLVTDPARLSQVLLSLLGNAVKFTGEGSIELRLRSLANGSAVRIEVADTGPGIPLKERRRLFTAFEHRGELTVAAAGIGVGLALAARLAALLGGSIGHHDNTDGGSVFWLELPSEPVAVSLPPTRLVGGAPAALRILVVDDVATDGDITVCLLSAAGHKVTCVPGGTAAIEAIAESEFDIVLMDLRMPEMAGLKAARQIRSVGGLRGQVPIVALLAQESAEQVAACRDAGIDGHLPKPLDPRTLTEAVLHAKAARETHGSGRAVPVAAGADLIH